MAVAAAGFVGRERELSELAGLLAEVAAGRGAAVLVEGEAGIGRPRCWRPDSATPANWAARCCGGTATN